MPIKSFKDKLTSFASGEILGSTDEEFREREQKAPPSPQKKEEEKKIPKERSKHERASKPPKKARTPREKIQRDKPAKPPKEKKEKSSFFKRKEPEEIDYDKNEHSIPSEPEIEKEEMKEKTHLADAVEGYEDVIYFLGIKEDLKVNPEFYAKDLDYIEFSQTTPLGFDFDEVTDFISRVKYTMSKLESALKQRDKDIIILASEVKKVEAKMTERAEAIELERMMGSATKEEKLAEENMELQIKVNQLEQRIVDVGSPEEVSQLKKTVEILKSENEMLRRSNSNDSLPLIEESILEEDAVIPNLEELNALDNFNENVKMPTLD